MKNNLALALALLSFSAPAKAEVFFNAQHAGYAGDMAAGLGYVGSSFGADALYGWTPENRAGHDVRSWTVKGLWYLFGVGAEARIHVRPYLGLGGIYSPDKELFLRLPSQYPDGYYVPSALRPALFTGLRMHVYQNFGASLEFTLIDSELAYIKNKGSIAYDQVGSVGIALHYNFSMD